MHGCPGTGVSMTGRDAATGPYAAAHLRIARAIATHLTTGALARPSAAIWSTKHQKWRRKCTDAEPPGPLWRRVGALHGSVLGSHASLEVGGWVGVEGGWWQGCQ